MKKKYNPISYRITDGKITVNVGEETIECGSGDIIHFKEDGNDLKLIRIEKFDGNDRTEEKIM